MSQNATRPAVALAAELGFEIEEIEGTGKDQKVTVPDVKRASRERRMGERPADIDGRWIQVWNEVKAYLEEVELWRPVFGEILANYVRCLKVAAEARKDVVKFGSTTIGSTGQTVAHPNVKIRRDAELDVLKYAGALLITPEAQQKYQGSDDDEDEGLGF